MGKIFRKPRLLKSCTLLKAVSNWKAICVVCGVVAYVELSKMQNIFFSGEAADKNLVLDVWFTSQTLAVRRDLPPFAPHRSQEQ